MADSGNGGPPPQHDFDEELADELYGDAVKNPAVRRQDDPESDFWRQLKVRRSAVVLPFLRPLRGIRRY